MLTLSKNEDGDFFVVLDGDTTAESEEEECLTVTFVSPARSAQWSHFADAVRREIVVMHVAFLLRCFHAVEELFISGTTQGNNRE